MSKAKKSTSPEKEPPRLERRRSADNTPYCQHMGTYIDANAAAVLAAAVFGKMGVMITGKFKRTLILFQEEGYDNLESIDTPCQQVRRRQGMV